MSFQSILIDGVFYVKDGQMLVKRDGAPEPTILADALEPLRDKNIQISVHHWPPNPVIQGQWGGGCCMWEQTGKCPAGHHENPAFLLNFSASGILRYTNSKWWVEVGKDIETIPLNMMEGHIGRIVAVTLIDANTFAEDMDFNLDNVDLDITSDPAKQAAQMDRIESQTQQLRGMMGDFMDLLKDINKKGG